MITPQQIEQISFGKQPFGGYDMEQVDEFLEPLTEDYITLYKENALLKSKMRVLVAKLEEYRANEASMKDAIVNAQKTCDLMVKEAEAKCAQMLSEAAATAAANASNADALVEAEAARVDEARQAAAMSIEEIENMLRSCLQTLEAIRTTQCPVAPKAEATEAPADSTEQTDQVHGIVDEIIQNLDITIDNEESPAESTTPKSTRFPKLEDGFGPNYNPTKK
jgi:cell division initiation protein